MFSTPTARSSLVAISLLVSPLATPSQSSPASYAARVAKPTAPAIHIDSGYIDVGDGVRIFARVIGGPHRDTLVLLHGGPGLSSSYLIKDIDNIAGRHTVVVYDQRGSGRSTVLADSSKVTIAAHVADLHSVLANFRILNANLYGHSWGAGLAAKYIAAHPLAVRRAILGSPIPPRMIPYMAQFGTNLTKWADSATRVRINLLSAARKTAEDPNAACRAYWSVFMRGYYGDTTRIRMAKSDVCDDPPLSLNNSVYRWTLGPEGSWDWRPLLAKTKVPVLVLHGASDPIPMESAREWVSAIPGAKLVVLDGCGHFPMVERPKELLAAIEAFLWPPVAQ